MSKSHQPAFIPMSLPPEYNVQWPPPSEQISTPSPVPGPAPMTVPKCPRDLPPGDPKIDSQSLPVPLSREPSPDPLSSPILAPLPVPVGETDSSNHSGSSPKGTAVQPIPKLVIATCKPPTPARTSSYLTQSSADIRVLPHLNWLVNSTNCNNSGSSL
ncbi:uncharacterized protein [Macrobrachium rosenbergii]|uniref:uncharacterized protein n=1 Tax=Macrobrachium rosenbergii TaxID=79674 RepID=UPI0034D5466F